MAAADPGGATLHAVQVPLQGWCIGFQQLLLVLLSAAVRWWHRVVRPGRGHG